jgi:alanine dehydrogenase
MTTRILTRSDVASLLSVDDCLTAVEAGFLAQGLGQAPQPGALGYHLPDGAFHVKVASMTTDRAWFAAKVNGNFFGNPAAGLPRIQGALVLCDAARGTPLALMDSTEITVLRTAAATAVAAKYLSPDDAQTATIAGCGLQGRAHIRALARVRDVSTFRLYDSDPAAAARLADGLRDSVRASLEPVNDLGAAARDSDIVVTCTPSRTAILAADDVAPGAFVAGVGADSDEKQELDPRLLAAGLVVTDSTAQCASFGDLRYAIAEGLMTTADVFAELAAIVAEAVPNPRDMGRTIVFDSTGTAIQDVASAAIVYQRAVERGIGTTVNLAE